MKNMHPRDFLLAHYQFVNTTNKPCYPITLSSTLKNLVQQGKVVRLELTFNDLPMISVNLYKHPEAVSGELFIPFYADDYFNLYEIDLHCNDVRVNAYDSADILLNSDLILKANDECMSCDQTIPRDYKDYLIRDRDNMFKMIRICHGALGIPYIPEYDDWN